MTLYPDTERALQISLSTGYSSIVIGKSGCGKTTICNKILDQANVRVLRPCYERCSCHRDFQITVTSFFETNHLDGRSKVMFLDDVDVLLTNNRFASLYLTTIVKKYCVMMTSCISEERRVADIKKQIVNIRIVAPGNAYLVAYFSELFRVHDIELIREIVCRTNGNIRCVHQDLQDRITIGTSPNSCKYFDNHVTDTVMHLFRNASLGMDDLLTGLANDPVIISFIMFDNYKKYVKSIKPSGFNTSWDNPREHPVCDIYEATSMFSNSAYTTNDWSILNIATTIQCAMIRYAIHKHSPTTNIKPDIASKYQIGYTQIPARAAQHYNTQRSRSQLMFAMDMSSENIDLLSEVTFESRGFEKSSINVPIAAYISNICSKGNRAYKVDVFFQLKNANKNY